MGGIIFVGRAFLITMALVLIMQVDVGDERLEYKVADFIRGSAITKTLQGVADGGVKLVRNVWNKVTKTLDTGFSNAISSGSRPGERDKEFINMERSKEYLKKKASSTKNSVMDHLRDEGIIETESESRPKRKFIE